MTKQLQRNVCLGCALLIASFAGCSVNGSGILFGPKLKGSGVVTSSERELADFNQIDISGEGNYTIFPGTRSHAIVTIDDNLQANTLTKVDAGTLKIYPEERYSSSNSLTVEVETVAVDGVHLSGSGDVFIEQVNSDVLELSSAGSSSFVADGTARHVSVSISGSGDFDLSNLLVESAEISISGSGSVIVNAGLELEVSIAGSGDVQYIGSPTINKSIAGSGSIRQVQ